jgi:phenylalanine-4-hydroxylase
VIILKLRSHNSIPKVITRERKRSKRKLQNSEIAIKYSGDSRSYELISKIYWATIEFGLICEDNQIKVYGAGIISSKGEVQNVLKQKDNYVDFDIQTVFDTDFVSSEIQTKYFVTESFEKLSNSLPEIERLLAINLKN